MKVLEQDPRTGNETVEERTVSQDMARMRLYLYRFLAGIFAGDQTEIRGGLAEAISTLDLYLEMVADEPEAAEAAKIIADRVYQQASALHRRRPLDHDELPVEYVRLFVNSAPASRSALPYASLYLGRNRLLMGDEAHTMDSLLQSEGLSQAEESGLMPDHLSVELELMSYLVSMEAGFQQTHDFERLEEYQAKEYNFLADHLAPFISALKGAVADADGHPFYRLAIELCESLAWADLLHLAGAGPVKGRK